MPQDNKLYKELLKQKDEISRQKKEIIESLEYACLIQTALLPQSSSIHKTLQDNFILYLPKDIVSGDFTGSLNMKKMFCLQQLIAQVMVCLVH